MKRAFVITALVISVALSLHSQQPVKILDFYMGMSKEEVKDIYTRMKEVPVAQYVSIEPGRYRDQIKVDNEFSSMYNKIDILYDDNGKVNCNTLFVPAVACMVIFIPIYTGKKKIEEELKNREDN